MASGPVLAVIDRAADDRDVVAEAVWLARAARASVLLVHVARPRAGDQTAFEVGVLGELQAWAEQVRAAGVGAHVEDVYFGEASAELAYAASRRRAAAVVAARGPATRLWARLASGQRRHVRLRRLLSVPLVLVESAPLDPPRLEAMQLEPQPAPGVCADEPLETPSPVERAA